MTSHKQQVANKANALRSTGPKSATGKAQSRMNSWKHGLAAETLVTGDEDPALFEELRSELFEEFHPSPGFECALVDRLAGLMWRLRRVPGLEAALLTARCAEIERKESALKRIPDAFSKGLSESNKAIIKLGTALIDDASRDVLGKLCRHEATLMSALTKTLQLLILLQSRRTGPTVDGVALPSRDVSPQ